MNDDDGRQFVVRERFERGRYDDFGGGIKRIRDRPLPWLHVLDSLLT